MGKSWLRESEQLPGPDENRVMDGAQLILGVARRRYAKKMTILSCEENYAGKRGRRKSGSKIWHEVTHYRYTTIINFRTFLNSVVK